MESLIAPFTHLAGYHLIAWGTLLGTELYQSFVMTKLCYVHLPRPQFNTLQKRVFPVYFNLQTGLVALTALTYPTRSIVGLVGNTADAVILGVALGTAVLNLLVYGPRTSKLMVERSHQGLMIDLVTRDGERDEANLSDEMKLLKRNFSHNHAMAIHLNLIGMIGTVIYGLKLGLKVT